MKGTPRAGGDLDGAFSLPVFSRERFYQLCSLLSSLAIDCFSFCVSLHRSFPLTFYCRPSFSLSAFRRYVRFCRLKLEFPSCEALLRFSTNSGRGLLGSVAARKCRRCRCAAIRFHGIVSRGSAICFLLCVRVSGRQLTDPVRCADTFNVRHLLPR